MPAVAPYLRIRQVQSLVLFRRLSLTPQRFAGSGSSKFQIIDASGGFKPDCNSLGHRQDTSDDREDVASQGSQKPSSEDVDVNSAVLATELLDDYVKTRNDAQATRRTSGDISRKYAIGEAERPHYGSPHPNLGSSSGHKRVYQLEDLVKDGLPFNKAAHAAPGTRMRHRRVALSGGSSGIVCNTPALSSLVETVCFAHELRGNRATPLRNASSKKEPSLWQSCPAPLSNWSRQSKDCRRRQGCLTRRYGG